MLMINSQKTTQHAMLKNSIWFKLFCSLLVLAFIVFIALKSWQAFEQLKYAGLDSNQGVIKVSATEKYSKVPNRAKITMYLSQLADTSEQAKSLLKQQEQKFLQACKDLKINQKYIDVQDFIISKNYKWENGKRIFNGYRASESVVINLDSVVVAKSLVNKLADYGYTNVSYRTYLDNQSMEQAKQEAIKKAIEKAKKQAKELSKALGVHLGKLVEYKEGRDYGYQTPLRASSAEINSNNLELPTGQRDYEVTVTLKYKVW